MDEFRGKGAGAGAGEADRWRDGFLRMRRLLREGDRSSEKIR